MVVLFMLMVVFKGMVKDVIEFFIFNFFLMIFSVIGMVVVLLVVLKVKIRVACIFFMKIMGLSLVINVKIFI